MWHIQEQIPNHSQYQKFLTLVLKVLTYWCNTVAVKVAFFWFLWWKMAPLWCQFWTYSCNLLNFFCSFLWCSKPTWTLLVHLCSRSLKIQNDKHAYYSVTKVVRQNSINQSSDTMEILMFWYLRKIVQKPKVQVTITFGTSIDSVILSWVIWFLSQ